MDVLWAGAQKPAGKWKKNRDNIYNACENRKHKYLKLFLLHTFYQPPYHFHYLSHSPPPHSTFSIQFLFINMLSYMVFNSVILYSQSVVAMDDMEWEKCFNGMDGVVGYIHIQHIVVGGSDLFIHFLLFNREIKSNRVSRRMDITCVCLQHNRSTKTR